MPDTLDHSGVRGMKWGIRKPEGSSGRKRRGGSGTGLRTNSTDHTTVAKLKKKKLSELSNEEIRVLANRIQLERQYKDLRRTKIDAGKKILAEILLDSGKRIAKDYLSANGTRLLNDYMDKVKKLKK